MLFINIHSKGRYPADRLSNFAPHTFQLDGLTIPCMEAFLQSLKFEDIRKQQRVLSMDAKEAKAYGSTQPWHRYLYWQGVRIDRFSSDYSALLERAYRALLSNPAFRQALMASGRKVLLHTIGKRLRKNTVLTSWEFTRLLRKLRKELNQRKEMEL